jgi:hypothetical protein
MCSNGLRALRHVHAHAHRHTARTTNTQYTGTQHIAQCLYLVVVLRGEGVLLGVIVHAVRGDEALRLHAVGAAACDAYKQRSGG